MVIFYNLDDLKIAHVGCAAAKPGKLLSHLGTMVSHKIATTDSSGKSTDGQTPLTLLEGFRLTELARQVHPAYQLDAAMISVSHSQFLRKESRSKVVTFKLKVLPELLIMVLQDEDLGRLRKNSLAMSSMALAMV